MSVPSGSSSSSRCEIRAVACRVQRCEGVSAAGRDDSVTDPSSAITWITLGWSTTIGYSNRTSDNIDAPVLAAAVESVCNRTDTGTNSIPLIRWRPGYGLASGASRACQRCAGGVVVTERCSPSRVPGLGVVPAVSTGLLILSQCCVWCQGVVGMGGWGSGGCGVCGAWVV